MRSKSVKFISAALAATMLVPFAACNDDDRGPGDVIDANYEWATEGNWNGTDVTDSSEIADYSGEHEI